MRRRVTVTIHSHITTEAGRRLPQQCNASSDSTRPAAYYTRYWATMSSRPMGVSEPVAGDVIFMSSDNGRRLLSALLPTR